MIRRGTELFVLMAVLCAFSLYNNLHISTDIATAIHGHDDEGAADRMIHATAAVRAGAKTNQTSAEQFCNQMLEPMF